MNDKTTKVFSGWLALTSAERSDFDDAVAKYQGASEHRKTEIRESMRKSATRMETGSLGRGCPCCGR